MSEFRFESPVTDDVFQAWLNRASTDLVKRKWGLEKNYISTVESVDSAVEKYAAFFFSSQQSKAGSEITKGKETVVPVQKLRGMTFYKFNRPLKPEEWGDKRSEVPIYDLKLKPCAKCKGGGKIKCNSCQGSGKLFAEVNVIVDAQKPRKEKFGYQCGTCAGTGHVPCASCSGIGGQYSYYLGTIPFKVARTTIPYFFFKSEFKFLGDKKQKEELEDLISSEKIAGIRINTLKELNEKHLTKVLGFWTGDTKRWMVETSRQFQQLENQAKRGGTEQPKYPIYIFPLLKLTVKPPKAKRFFVYSVGSGKAFSVFDEGFK
ncbi:MAG: hypothetical protein ACFFBD_28830 [Candidatus Hodarchaeota archaeon]